MSLIGMNVTCWKKESVSRKELRAVATQQNVSSKQSNMFRFVNVNISLVSGPEECR
jgi:hypothetical protein